MYEFKKCVSCGQYTIFPEKDLSDESKKRAIELDKILEDIGERRKKWLYKLKDNIQLTKEEGDLETKYISTWNERQAISRAFIKMMEDNLYFKCSHCNEKLFPDILHEEDVIRLGYKLYGEYISWMGLDKNTMPEDIIIRVGSFTDPAGRCIYDKDLKKFIISIRRGEDFYRHDLPAIFFHEFTHVNDLYDPITGEQKKEKDCSHWYTEYRASEIEMMKILGYEHINDNKSFRLSSRIISRSKTKKLVDYLDDQILGFSREIEKFCKYGLKLESITSMLRFFMYCRSKINFVKNHLGEDSIKLIPSVDSIEKKLESLLDNDAELSELLKELDNCITNSSEIINKRLLEDIIQRIQMQLISHVPQHKHLRSMDAFINYLNEEREKENI